MVSSARANDAITPDYDLLRPADLTRRTSKEIVFSTVKSNRPKDFFAARRNVKNVHQPALVSRKWRCYEISV